MKKFAKLLTVELRNYSVIAAAILTAVTGVYFSGTSRAAQSFISMEPEKGTVIGSASMLNNSAASGGQAIRFGASIPGTEKCGDLKNLIFCDDFDAPAGTAPDSTKWRILGGSSWGGQCFKDLRENIAHDGIGNLKQTLINKSTVQCKDSSGYPSSVTSGGIDTAGKQYFRYGTFEVRAKIACAKSVWGAIWTATGTGPDWPQSGEMDIYEIFNNTQSTLKNTIHAGNPRWNTGKSLTLSKPFCEDFHVYGLIWRKGIIQFTFNGAVTNTFTEAADAKGRPWPFDTYDQRLIIDLQYGGPGQPNAGDYDVTQLPDSMLIDYVRVYN